MIAGTFISAQTADCPLSNRPVAILPSMKACADAESNPHAMDYTLRSFDHAQMHRTARDSYVVVCGLTPISHFVCYQK